MSVFLSCLSAKKPSWWMHISKNIIIQSCHIFKKNKNGCFIFDFFWIRSVQNGSNLIKPDQTGFPHQSKSVTIKSCLIYRKDKNDYFNFWVFFIRPVQTWSNLIKLDQIWFPHQSKNVSMKICHIYRKDKNGSFVFDFFFWSDLSKMDQTWSNLIKLDNFLMVAHIKKC